MRKGNVTAWEEREFQRAEAFQAETFHALADAYIGYLAIRNYNRLVREGEVRENPEMHKWAKHGEIFALSGYNGCASDYARAVQRRAACDRFYAEVFGECRDDVRKPRRKKVRK